MNAHRTKTRWIARLTFALVAVVASASPAPAGPISDMLARHRQARSMKLPPIDKPFTIKKIKDPNLKTASLSQRFKQRFGLKRGGADGSVRDQGVVKTSR